MSQEADFIRVVAARNIVRVRVAGIVIRDGQLLVQWPTDDPSACFALIGGEYEVGDSFESRLRCEFEEETTTARVKQVEYRFVVENRFQIDGRVIHSLEHYFEVDLDGEEVCSAEPGLSQHWLPLATIREYDLRLAVVREVIAFGEFRQVRHLVVELPSQAAEPGAAPDGGGQ